MEPEEAMDSLLGETPSLIPALSLPLPQASQGPPTASPAAPAAASTSGSSSQGKAVKASWGRRWEAGAACGRSSDLPRVRLQVKEESVLPQIKLEPHEVDQFLNLSPKGVRRL